MSKSGTILYDSISETLYLNGKSLVPSGSLIQYAGSSAPNGWMLCHGQSLNISSYPSLFSVLSNTYGGDGIITFVIPDLRGRVTVGSNSSYPLSSTGWIRIPDINHFTDACSQSHRNNRFSSWSYSHRNDRFSS